MKINIVVGGTFHFPILARNLIDLGYDVMVYTSTPKFKIKDTFLHKHIIYVPMPFQIVRKITGLLLFSWQKHVDATFFDFVTSVIMRKCDILYGFAGNSLMSGLQAQKNGSLYILDRACPHIKFQTHLFEREVKSLDIKSNRISKGLTKRALKEYRFANKIIVPSLYTFNSFIENNIDKNKLAIIPLDAKLGNTKKIFSYKAQKNFTIGTIGGGLVRKGYLYLFRAFAELDLEKSLLIVKANKKELFRSNEIREICNKNKNIIFIGYQKQIIDFYKSCDIFILPSIDEGFGMVVLEAMACSLPVIVTQNVGSAGFIENGKNGFVIKTREPRELMQKISFFYNNRKKIKQFGIRSSQIYRENFIQKDTYKLSLKSFFESIDC